MTRILRARIVIVTAGLALLLGGCPPWSDWLDSLKGRPAGLTSEPSGLARFGSAQELLDYFKQQAAMRRDRANSWYDAESGSAADLAAPAGSKGESPTYTSTNVQVVGVDESDVFKSDGRHFYIGKGESLRIVAAAPLAELAEVGRVDLDARIDELYLLGSKAIAIGRPYRPGYAGGDSSMMWPPYYNHAVTTLFEIDVSDPAHPAVIAQNELEGSLVSSRVIDTHLILVLTIATTMPTDVEDESTVTLDQVLPKMNRGNGGEPLVPPENWYRPLSPDGCFTTAVVTLDANDITTVIGSAAILASAGTVYCSTEALYLTDTAYTMDYKSRGTTAIHKLAFDSDGVAIYVASGTAPGRLLNQFSLDERNGHLRVATQVQDERPADYVSDGTIRLFQHATISVLAEQDGALNIVGQIDDIAPGEIVHSSRFMGDHGFLVTYRKVDPLFVLDLANPSKPRIAGELKIPGFSEYLHPLDDTHLIGVGKWTIPTDGGFDWYQGVQLSLFDVSDWSNPQAVQQIQFGGRGSECDVFQTHKAFTFLADQGLLALPMQLATLNEEPSTYGEREFSGVLVFQVDAATGFTELGRFAGVDPVATYEWDWDWDWSSWHRAALIGDTVYCLTNRGVAGAPLNDLEHPAEIEFE